MPKVQFTPQLRRFIETQQVDSVAGTLRAALEDAFTANPRLRGYVLDDQGALRANVVAFIDGERCLEPQRLDQALKPDSTVYVLQGTITDHRDGIATDYGPGVGWPEDRTTLHWLENRGTVPAVEISVDVVEEQAGGG